ncbi:hypothetical protein PORY_001004 [Pneumocystis oryctolagi]|uniref:Uncharacterized protein n=1 Tax=Pneumocystis oryctolagi TaxID=42067 RepID=A0ACB7CEP4_9ASCO|nr:hypothetical protein PORY_001004 [Pneumocystis oryctolagi]
MKYTFLYILYSFIFLRKIYSLSIIQPINIQKALLLENVSLFPHSEGYSGKLTYLYLSFDLVFKLPYYFQKTEHLGSMKKYIKLSMEPNLDLLNEMSFLHVQNEYGEIVHSEKINRDDYRVYRGKAYITYGEDDAQISKENWYEAGWARVSLFQDTPIFEGSFSLFEDLYTVKTLKNYVLFKEFHELNAFGCHDCMVIWRDSDQSVKTFEKKDNIDNKCLYENLGNSHASSLFNLSNLSFNQKRQGSDIEQSSLVLSKDQLILNIGNTFGCPKHKKIAFMGAALDCNYISLFPSTRDATNHILTLYNKVSAIYEKTFNISLGLLNITVMDRVCPVRENSNILWNTNCSSSYNISDRLRQFSTWRSKLSDNIALWSLFTTCRTSLEVGVAWFGVLCQDTIPKSNGIDSISGTNVIASPVHLEDLVLAHEIGHGFGASHDCTEQTCQDPSASCCPSDPFLCSSKDKFIMSPKGSTSLKTFSPCTIGQICSNLGKKLVNSKCLLGNKNVVLLSKKKCGNGIVEDGEDCDCGGEDGCKGNLCCDPKTCKFTFGSVCDDSSEACCKNCQFAPKNTVCRPSHDECDIAEVCTGNSSVCPSDSFKKDGTPCSNGLKCASGICTSRDMQCISQFNNSKGSCYSSCILFCEIGNSCVYSGLQNYFIDGTPCGFYGRCYKGNCIEGNLGKQFRALLIGFKKWVFVVVFILGLIFVSIIGCIFCRLISYKDKDIHDDDYYHTIYIPTHTKYPSYNYQNTIPNMSQAHFDSYRKYYNYNQRNAY